MKDEKQRLMGEVKACPWAEGVRREVEISPKFP